MYHLVKISTFWETSVIILFTQKGRALGIKTSPVSKIKC